MVDETVKALFESLSDLLRMSENGEWYQVSAYVRRNADGTTEVRDFGAFPVRSGRTLRIINEAVRREDSAL